MHQLCNEEVSKLSIFIGNRSVNQLAKLYGTPIITSEYVPMKFSHVGLSKDGRDRETFLLPHLSEGLRNLNFEEVSQVTQVVPIIVFGVVVKMQYSIPLCEEY